MLVVESFHFYETTEASLAIQVGRMVCVLEDQLMMQVEHVIELAMMPLGQLLPLFDWQKVVGLEVTELMD